MNTKIESKKDQWFKYWLYLGLFMALIQVILGGITRLTGSGLSITEWKLVTGIFPPLSTESWQHEFELYQKSPQFNYLNSYFILEDFKKIYFWEWLHRFWARSIGIIFIIGIIYFSYFKVIAKSWYLKFFNWFVLGGLQGLVGWIMVKSGLMGDAVYVHPIKLATHFCLALILIGYMYWCILDETNATSLSTNSKTVPKFGRVLSGILVILILIQFWFGALVAGSKAAIAAPTWPTLNGQWIPNFTTTIQSTTNYLIKIQFYHRSTGYILLIFALFYTLYQKKHHPSYWILGLLLVQVVLGITTLYYSSFIQVNQWQAFEWSAIIHQINGMLVFLVAIYQLFKNYETRFLY
ncbi:MAG: COX15/CtaA family protein [Alphaproteobacteria bacterium]|nr:COX15/CtaA family protein [Alphaproteobacteria bacterium]